MRSYAQGGELREAGACCWSRNAQESVRAYGDGAVRRSRSSKRFCRRLSRRDRAIASGPAAWFVFLE